MLRSSFVIVCCLFAASCAVVNVQDFQHAKTELTPADTIMVKGDYDKLLLLKNQKRLFCLNKTSFKIDIYNIKNGEKLNTIGGIGFSNFQFNNLTDIALSHDDHLLALDSFQKKIKQYSGDGEYLGSISLAECSSPELITVLDENNWIIFDGGTKELIQFSSSASGETLVLDKIFDIKPQKLFSTDKWIFLYSSEDNQTLVFSDLGNFTESAEGFHFQYNITKFKVSEISDMQNDKVYKILMWNKNKVDVADEYVLKRVQDEIIVYKPEIKEVDE